MKKNAKLIGLGLLIVLLFLGNAAQFYKLNFVDQLSNILYDYRLQWTMPRTVDERVVILDIDEKSLKEEGRWPWSRDRLAVLMDKLFDQYGVQVVGFDVVFAEQDESSGLKVLQQLGQTQLKGDAAFQSVLAKISPQLEYDHLFASKIKNRKVVLGYYFTNLEEARVSGLLPASALPVSTFKNNPISFQRFNGYGANLPLLQQAAFSAGHFNPIIDADGEVRRVPILIAHDGAYYESLSLAVVRALFDQLTIQPGFVDEYAGLEWLALGQDKNTLKIPVDAEVAALVPYRGEQGSFRYFSIADVLHDRVNAAHLKDKIVLVGTTALGLQDMRSTPVGKVFPGVEVHANLIAGILDQNLKHRPAYMEGVEVLWILLIGCALSVWLPLMSPLKAVGMAMMVFAASWGVSVGLWQYSNIYLSIANSLLMVTMLFVLNMSYGYFFATRTKRQITERFKNYVPAELVDEMSQHPEQLVSMDGDSREMTMLFSDVRGFTSISEGMDSKNLSKLMNEFLTPLSRVISKHEGKVDKYMGDCIMAFWGAPKPQPNHARNAILAGIEMQQTLRELQPHFKAKGWPEIHVGVGINSGRVSVGNMGSEVRVAYTVMGDAVNLASRLESITKQYGVGIIVGENTRRAAPDFVYRELDQVKVVGKDKPVAIYEPIGLVGEVSLAVQDEVERFHQARQFYCAQNWDQAEQQLLSLQDLSPNVALYKIYLERVTHFRREPPAQNWDGVFVFHSK
ncbi:MAG: adenylate/guanylate cyclase domain-containing protein [Gallionella sp.]